MPIWFLGVDGGQSSTTALIGDETGRVVGAGRGGPCNHITGDQARDRFLTAIGGAVAQAASAAGLRPTHREFAVACFGFSGGPEDKRALVSGMFDLGQAVVTTDALVALTGATRGLPGIITIAGTGSVAFGRNAESRVARAGGWGYVYGDEGGGFDLARQAVRAALRHEEGWGTPTSLRGLLIEATASRDIDHLLHRLYTPEFSRPLVAGWARIVDAAAAGGDAVARELLSNAAQQLASIAAAVRRQLFLDGDLVLVCPVGGVFRSAVLRERFRMLVELEDGNRVEEPAMGPAAGALLEAYRAGGATVSLSGVPEFEK